ncbi:MAG: single-stranded DNA-binding protein [Tenericutes bacterium]|nr:single-stranded DNA-binding protein [Mycoplasmatota bacterium]
MMNQAILVGRLVADPELTVLDSGLKVTTITIAIKRNFKSGATNEYETDFLKCTLWSGIAEATVNYCKKGYTVGIKARLQQKYFIQGEKKIFSYPEIIAEQVTFINKVKEK